MDAVMNKTQHNSEFLVVSLSPLGTAATTGLIVRAPDDKKW
jgi:hypothetical protein